MIASEAHPAGARSPGAPAPPEAWARREPLQAATAAGLLVYASFLLDYFIFYGRFGVEPGEVGLDYVSTLSQSLVGGLLIFAVVLIPLSSLALAIFVPAAAAFRRKRALTIVLAMAGIGVGAVAGWFLPVPGLFGVEEDFWGWLGVTLVVWEITFLLLEGDDEAQSMTRRAKAIGPRVVAVAALLVFFVLMPVMAHVDGAAVADGRARPFQWAGFLALPWKADASYVSWVDGPPPDDFVSETRCFMYLGRSDGLTVLWSPDYGETHRVPSTRITMTSRDDPVCNSAGI